MSALTAYRALLRIVGPTYVVVAFLGRVPLAMSQMGTLLLVSDATGRYALGGASAGALAVANAVGAPFFGSLADRVGQRPVVLAQSVLGGAGLVLLVVVTHRADDALPIIATAALAGLAIPQIGPLARVRWAPILRRERDRARLVDTAFSYEGAADEVSFVLGPATVGLLAVVVDPGEALLVAGLVLVGFGSWFALHPTARLTEPEPGESSAAVPVLTAALVVLAFAQFLIGMLFGGTQTGATVLATDEGRAGVAGLIHATLGIGSATAGLAVAALPERISYELRMAVSAVALAVLALPLLLVDSIGSLVAVIAVLGFAVAPYMIGNFAMAGRDVHPTRVGLAMTLLAGATGIGYAAGSSLAGRLADAGGYTPAFGVTVGATLAAAVLSLVVWLRSRRAA
ncbi:MAG: MFS transporter [Aeromicrobium erythreum]